MSTLDLVLAGGTVVDGSGAPRRAADIGIDDDRIVAIGDLAAAEARERIDVSGLTVAPGFVDMHAHSDLCILSSPRARSKIRQGVTTEVVGNCGLGPTPAPPEHAEAVRRAAALIDLDGDVAMTWTDVAGYREAVAAVRPALNIAPLAGHIALRIAVAGEEATVLDAATVARLERAADRALDEGAVGISTGLMYPPVIDADTAELEAIGRAVARHDALFAVHMRDYSGRLEAAVREAIAVARATGCRLQLSHLAVTGRRNWGGVGRALEIIDAALAEGIDVGFDIYPYLAGSANLSQLLPDWAQVGGPDAVLERLTDASTRQRVRSEWARSLHIGWDDVVVALVDDDLAAATLGRTVAEAAVNLGLQPDEAALELIVRTEDRVQMVAFGRSPDDLAAGLRHSAAVIGSDGSGLDPDGATGVGRPHPRSYGCYPRILGRTVREEGLLSLERAVAMSTALPAARARLRDRGLLREGAFADVVVFDAGSVIDEATYEEPARFPSGIEHVLVNGRAVVAAGHEVDGPGPGHVLTHG